MEPRLLWTEQYTHQGPDGRSTVVETIDTAYDSGPLAGTREGLIQGLFETATRYRYLNRLPINHVIVAELDEDILTLLSSADIGALMHDHYIMVTERNTDDAA